MRLASPVVSAAIIVALSIGCSRKRPEPAPNAVSATLEAIEAKPNAYLGRRITVSGEISRIHGPRAFTVSGRRFLFERELLVLTPHDFKNVADRPGGEGLNEGDAINVTGELHTLDVAETERELAFDLSPEFEEDFANRPVLIVDPAQHTHAPRAEAVGGGPSVPMDAPIADLKLLLDAPPDDILGKDVAIEDVKVQGVIRRRAIWVGPSQAESVLVALPQEMDLHLGDSVDIRGRVDPPPTGASAVERFGALPEETRVIAAEPNMIVATAVTRTKR